jgi:hypothetical protein
MNTSTFTAQSHYNWPKRYEFKALSHTREG